MKHKVAELDGALLDAAVAKAADLNVVTRAGGQPAFERPFDPEGPAHEYPVGHRVMYLHFKPSTNWNDGGPIIERERIAVVRMAVIDDQGEEHFEFYAWVQGSGIFHGIPTTYFDVTPSECDGRAATYLVAAMRAYVASKFGDEVELPDGAAIRAEVG